MGTRLTQTLSFFRPECGLKRGPVTQDDAFRSNDFEACGFKEVKGENFKNLQSVLQIWES